MYGVGFLCFKKHYRDLAGGLTGITDGEDKNCDCMHVAHYTLDDYTWVANPPSAREVDEKKGSFVFLESRFIGGRKRVISFETGLPA